MSAADDGPSTSGPSAAAPPPSKAAGYSKRLMGMKFMQRAKEKQRLQEKPEQTDIQQEEKTEEVHGRLWR